MTHILGKFLLRWSSAVKSFARARVNHGARLVGQRSGVCCRTAELLPELQDAVSRAVQAIGRCKADLHPSLLLQVANLQEVEHQLKSIQLVGYLRWPAGCKQKQTEAKHAKARSVCGAAYDRSGKFQASADAGPFPWWQDLKQVTSVPLCSSSKHTGFALQAGLTKSVRLWSVYSMRTKHMCICASDDFQSALLLSMMTSSPGGILV